MGVGILDVIFPKYCISCKTFGFYICSSCFSYLSFNSKEVCAICNKPTFDGLTHPSCWNEYGIDGVFTALVYEGVVKKLIYRLKYKPFLTDLIDTLVELFYESLIQKEALYRVVSKSESIMLVPIPLHSEKLKKRGFNQAKLLTKGLSKKLGIEWKEVLLRVKPTRSQVGLKRDKRQENIQNAFLLREKINGKTVFLVDDVTTTGATFQEAAMVLKRNGVEKVYGIALAREL